MLIFFFKKTILLGAAGAAPQRSGCPLWGRRLGFPYGGVVKSDCLHWQRSVGRPLSRSPALKEKKNSLARRVQVKDPNHRVAKFDLS